MSKEGNDIPADSADEALLRFLDTAPRAIFGEDRLRFAPPEAASTPCPPAGSFLEIASGRSESHAAAALLSHAACCSACGEELARSLSFMEGNSSAEEAAAIAELASMSKEWQRKLALELAGTPAQPKPAVVNLRSTGFWLSAAVVAAVLVAAVSVFLWRRQATSPEHELAVAYTQSRRLELRVPEAGYAPLREGGHTRGALADSEPAPLLEARARLARELEKAPQDARWLQLQARADVLEERYDSAADVLDRLLAQGPATPELLADAASAYFQRGLVTGSELDRSTALEYLRRADELAPADPVILFNEAIVMEDRGQMINAVEVWNRYITVERDPDWASEGKRKLAALVETLNRLKSHQSRVRQMLATPEAMEALARDPAKLASLDEELSSYELGTLLQAAYPVSANAALEASAGQSLDSPQQARGSPCAHPCMAARRLLQAIGNSLEIQHRDSWLASLVSLDIETLPAAQRAAVERAMGLLASATQQDLTGDSSRGASLARDSLALFQRLKSAAAANSPLETSARAGEARAEVETLFALQRKLDFRGCRAFASQRPGLSAGGGPRNPDPYPWIETQWMIVEQICDDTPETRRAGRQSGIAALRLAEADNYLLLEARSQAMLSSISMESGDVETGEREVVATLRKLYAADTPPLRIANTIAALADLEQDSPLIYRNESLLRESLYWVQLTGSANAEALTRIELARQQIRLGARKEAAEQLRLAHEQGGLPPGGGSRGNRFSEAEIYLATALLEQGNLAESKAMLDRAAADSSDNSDQWAMRPYAAARGMLELVRGQNEAAASLLEAEIHLNEGGSLRPADRASAAEFARLDHDLYGELAAAWLAQGRSPESVLALWERFRLRSRGLPIAACRQQALDCEQPLLARAERGLGANLLIGQIVLLDRALIYRVDTSGVAWTVKPIRRQELIRSAQMLEQVVSSPTTTLATATGLGANLRSSLLPALPASLGPDAALLLEPDPMLANLSWPVLPGSSQPLGLQYPMSEVRSILAAPGLAAAESDPNPDRSPAWQPSEDRRALVVGASVVAEGEPPLPEALLEAEAVRGFLRESTLLLGQRATAARVAGALDSAAVFHFAGHASQIAGGTKLLLAPESPGDPAPWVDGRFLRQHPPRACRLAVLSACATGAHSPSWNDPLEDLVETLGALGVRQVVATRWQVDSAASVSFMDAFYSTLSQGGSVAMALAEARRVQSARLLYRNPYYWGAYYVSGGESQFPQGAFHVPR